jgi:lysophosphatidate acyltransferase
MVEFKKGAFHMAIQNQAPIIPVVFSSYYYFLRPKEKLFNSGKIIIEALPEISTVGLTVSDLNDLMRKTKDIMVEKFNELNDELRTQRI